MSLKLIVYVNARTKKAEAWGIFGPPYPASYTNPQGEGIEALNLPSLEIDPIIRFTNFTEACVIVNALMKKGDRRLSWLQDVPCLNPTIQALLNE